MNNSIFDLMQAEDLTNFKIQYNWRNKKTLLYAAKEWDKDIDWTRYNKDFSRISIIGSNNQYYNNTQCLGFFQKHNLNSYLEEILTLMAKGRNYMEDFYYWEKGNVRFANNIHSVRLGLNNRYDCIYMGAMRRHDPKEDEIEMLIDGMNLGRAMAFKNFAAGVPMGGAKICVQQDPLDVNNEANLAFLAYAIDRTGDCTGPDMYYPTNMVRPMNQNYTLKISGHPDGPLGASGTPTAYGSYLASKEAARFLWGSPDIKDKSVAIMGLGNVGYHLTKHYIEEGCRVIIADPLQANVERVQKDFPKANITVVPADKIIYEEADIFAPAAIGGILNEGNLNDLKFKIIFGPANNQIKASSPEEEMEFAKKLAAKNILFQVEWWHNVAGVMCAFEEYSLQDKADRKVLYDKVAKVCVEGTRSNLEGAKKENITPTERCYKVASEAIYSQEPFWKSF